MTMQLSAIMNLTGNFAAQIQKNAELMKGIKGQADQAGSSIKNAFSNPAIGQKMASGLALTRDALGAAGIASAGFLKTCVDGATKAQKTNADLAQTIKSTGGAAGLTAAQVSAMATSFSKTTTFGAGAIKTGQNMLLTFTNIGKDVFPMATQAMLDLSQKMGGDPVSSSLQLGKALNDPTKGITALTRVGITFTEQQKKQIQTMQATGNMAGAQKLILGELNKEFGGQAAAAAKTYDGQMKQLGNTIGGIKGAIGSALLPYLQGIAEKLNTGAQSVSKFVGEHKKLVATVLSMTAIFGTLIGGVGLFSKVAGFLGPAVTGIAGLIGGLSLPILLVIGAIAALVLAYTKNFGGLKTSIDKEIGGISSAFKMATSQFKKTGDAIGAIGVFITNVFGNKVSNTVTITLTNIKTIVMNVISTIKAHMPEIKVVVQSVFQGIATIWNSILKPVLKLLMSAIGEVISWVVAHFPQIQKVIATVFQGVMNVWNSILKPVLKFIITEISKVVQWVVINWPLIKQTIGTVLNGVMNVVKSVLTFIQAFWNTWGQTIMDYVTVVWNNIKIAIQTVIHVIQDVIKAVMQAINGDWKGAWASIIDAVKTIFGGVGAIISNILNGIGKIFVDIAKVAVGWGKDMIDGIITGIKSSIGGIEDAVKGVGNKIKSFLHFSVPDEGPLKDYMTWMPDFMGGLSSGITANIPLIQSAISKVTSSMNMSKPIKINTQQVITPIKDVSLGIKTNLKDTSSNGGKASTATEKGKLSIIIAKLADQIIIREEADIDKLANALLLKLNAATINMA
ncbi:phage tail protein [Clostridium tagluense]|uniref:phage tail protein n=1 Tax=Clostridium tagluense TaxID=360422 RepID=UPI001C6F5293|nr:hypothetical protein [Clostridium tagluense]WLC67152.1 phage tail length tape measure family protein [Clostridium tagluense]